MSGSSKQLAGGLLGAFVGSYFGFAGIGFSLGSALFASSPDTDIGSDPGDLSFSTAAYGKFKFFGYGSHMVTTFPFWATDYTAHENVVEQSGGKGGGGGSQSETFYTYTRSSAYFLCDCEEGEPITGIKMIRNKVDGEIYYYAGADANAATIIQSNKFARNIRIYTGTDAQTPDPLIVSKEGWSPAFKRRAYIVIEDEVFGEQKGNRILEIEVVRGGSEIIRWNINERIDHPQKYGGMVITNYDNGVYRIWDQTINTGKVHLVSASGEYIGSETVDTELNRGLSQDSFPVDFGFTTKIGVLGSGISTYYIYGTRITEQPAPTQRFELQAYYFDTTLGYTLIKNFHNHFDNSRELVGISISADRKRMLVLMGAVGVSGSSQSQSGIWYMFDENANLINTGLCDYTGKVANGIGLNSIGANNIGYQNRATMLESNYEYLWTATSAGARDADIWRIDENNLFSHFSTESTATDGINAFDDLTLYADNGVMVFAATYRFDNFKGIFSSFSRNNIVSDVSPLLPNVVTEFCQRAKRDVAQYDVSLLPATPVRMRINRLRSGRDWLLEFGRIYGYRMRKSGDVVQFIPKGEASVATIPQADLGMETTNGGGEPNLNPPINAARIEGVDLPRSVTVLFTDSGNGYAAGHAIYTLPSYEQGQDITLNLKHFIMSASEATNLAQIACKEPHLERMGWETSLGLKWMALEAADVIDLPTGRAWIKSIIERGDSILRVTLQAEASAAYTGNGLPGAAPSYTPPTISLVGPTLVQVFDAPALTASMVSPGYLLAATGYLDGWSGANIYISSNGGETFSLLTAFDTPCIMGYAVDVLPDGPVGVWDRASTVTVQLYNSASFSSVTIEDALNGDNGFILGDEVCKVVDVVAIGNDQFELSMLQRGRKGTEWATTTHAIGDRFLLLNSAVKRIPVSIDAIGTERLLKAVSLGNELADTQATTTITPETVGVKPWPPANAEAYQSGADWIINCVERTRAGGEWRNSVGIVRDPDFDGWDLEILSDDGLTVIYTQTGLSSPTFTYTEAQQIIDFGSAKTSLRFRWYQRSLVIGRGYPSEEIAA